MPDVLESGMLDRALGVLRAEEREALFLSLLHRAKKKLRQILGGGGGV